MSRAVFPGFRVELSCLPLAVRGRRACRYSNFCTHIPILQGVAGFAKGRLSVDCLNCNLWDWGMGGIGVFPAEIFWLGEGWWVGGGFLTVRKRGA